MTLPKKFQTAVAGALQVEFSEVGPLTELNEQQTRSLWRSFAREFGKADFQPVLLSGKIPAETLLHYVEREFGSF